MTSSNPFLNWLDGAKCKTGLVNSYYYACLVENFRGSKEHTFSVIGLKILDELEKENNDHEIRQLIIQFLKIVQPERDIQQNNYMIVLREFVAMLYYKIATNLKEAQKSIPFPKEFNGLKTEVKLWILHSLLQYNSSVVHHPKPIGRDSTGNLYFIVNKTMLYVQYGTKLQEMTRTEEDRKWNSLERRLFTMPQWKLLAESREQWTQISMLLENFDEEDIANRINEEIERSATINKVEKPNEVNESNAENFARGITARRSRTQLRKPPSVKWADDERQSSHSPSQRSSSSHQHFEADGSSMESLPQNEQSIFGQRSKTIRCMYYPKCNRSNEECHFIHPDHKCNNFGSPSCPGIFCRFIHPICAADGVCTNNYCTYEHYKTMPSLRRIHYAKMKEDSQSNSSTREEDENHRFVSSGINDPVVRMRQSFEDQLNIAGRSTQQRREPSPLRKPKEFERPNIVPIHNERPFSNKELRCHYFPRCNKPAEICTYAHPREHCTSFPNCVRGRDCPLLHGKCNNDGGCINEFCSFEHYQQIPPRASINYQRLLQQKRGGQF